MSEPSRPQRCAHRGATEGGQFPPRRGLGDLVSSLAAAAGVDKEGFERALQTVGVADKISGGCTGCNRRHRILNVLGAKIGFPHGMTPELEALTHTLIRKRYAIYHCDFLDTSCVAQLRTETEAQRAIIEQNGVILCEHCAHYTL